MGLDRVPGTRLTEDDLDQLVLSQYPYPIAVNYERLIGEHDWEKKTRLCLRVFEFGLRAIALGLISQYLVYDAERVRDPQLNQLLLRRLSRATLGTWNEIFFKTLQAYQDKRNLLFMTELYDLYWETSASPHRRRKGIRAPFDRLVQIRNDLAHGLPPRDRAGWQALFEQTFHLLRQVLRHFAFLKNYDLIHITEAGDGEYWYDTFTGLQVESPSQPIKTSCVLTEGWLYLSKQKRRFLELHPLLIFWENELIQSGEERTQDAAMFDRFRRTSVDYLATVLGERLKLTDRTLIAEFVHTVMYTIERVKTVRREAQKLNWWLLKEVVKRISSERIGDLRTKYRPEVYMQREEAKQTVEEFLASDKTCLVLTGKSGVGKTSSLLSLMEEQKDSAEICVLMYNGARFSAETDVVETLTRDFELRLKLRGLLGREDKVSDILLEINRVEGMTSKKMILVIDAINENPNAKRVLRRIDALVEANPFPWLKVIVSSRPETWRTVMRGVRLAEHKYYHQKQTQERETEMQPLLLAVEMKPFGRDELPRAYAKYQRVFDLQTDYERIPAQVRQMLKDPLTMWLVAVIHRRQEIPDNFKASELTKEYTKTLLQTQRVYIDDIRFLERELLPLMIQEGKYVNSITDEAISETKTTSGESLFELIHSDEMLSNGRRVNHSYANLVDSGILVETGDPQEYEIAFRYERFWDYFGGKQLFALLKDAARPADAYRSIILSMDEHPYMWGVVLNALLRVMGDGGSDVIVQLARCEEPDCRDLAATVLVEHAQENHQAADEILRMLYPVQVNAALTHAEENQAIVGVEVAAKLKKCEILEHALTARSQTLRDYAIVRVYRLWRNDNLTGFSVLERIMKRINLKNLILKKAGIDSSIWLSTLVFLKHFEDPDTVSSLQNLWKPVIEQFLLYNPDSASPSGERFKLFLRKNTLRLIIGIFWRLAWDIPTRYSVMNLQEFQEFYRLPQQVKCRALELTCFLDPEHDDMQLLGERLLELFSVEIEGRKLNDMVLKLLIDYVLVAQGQKHLREVLALTKRLASNELERPGGVKRIMWDKSWVYAALALLQSEVDDQLFTDYTELVWRYITEVQEWRGPLSEHAYIGYADYAQIFVKKHGHSRVSLLRELLDWAVNTQNHQLVLDVLEEMGYLASSPNWPVVLAVIEPVLRCQLGRWSRSSDQARMVEVVRIKLIDVLATVWNTNPYQTEDYLDVQRVPSWLQERIRVRKTDQRIVADLLKGGLGPWCQFEVSQGFSPQGRHEMIWLFRTAIRASSFNHLLFQAAQKAINIIYGEEIFSITR